MNQIPEIYFYFNGAFVRRENGAHARAIECLEFVSGLARKVTVYSYENHPDWPWTQSDRERFQKEFPNASLVLDRRTNTLRFSSKLKTILISLLPSLENKVLRMKVPGAAPNYKMLQRTAPIIVNYVSGLMELNGIEPNYIVETHDIQFLNAARRADRPVTDLKIVLKARSELELVRRAGATIAISAREADLFRLLCPEARIFFVPAYAHGTNAGVTSPTFTYDLVFVGSEHPFNVAGIARFIETHREWLAGRRLAIAGRVCQAPPVIKAGAGAPNVELLGYVDDLGGLYARSKAAISPVEGTGLKVKLLDAFRNGKPVFASAHSLEALPGGYEHCAFPISEGEMDSILDDADQLGRAENAARLYASSLDKTSNLEELRTFLLSSAPRPAST